MYHYYLLVSAADGITAPFTSQTSLRKSSGCFKIVASLNTVLLVFCVLLVSSLKSCATMELKPASDHTS